MTTLALALGAILAALSASLTGAGRGAGTPDPAELAAARERRARVDALRGALVDASELRCAARAVEDPGNPDPCHTLDTVRVGTREGEPVNVTGCRYCGQRAVDICANAGDVHARQALAEEIRRRGHRVRAPVAAELARRAGYGVAPAVGG